jgi:hypothetical protein
MTESEKKKVVDYLYQKSLLTIYRSGFLIDEQANKALKGFIQTGVNALTTNEQLTVPDFYGSPKLQEAEANLDYAIHAWLLAARKENTQLLTLAIWERIRAAICPLFPFC